MISHKVLNRIITRILIIKGNFDVKNMLDNAKDAGNVNLKTLYKILDDNKNSEYGIKHGFANIHSIQEYQNNVPIVTFNDLKPYVDRIYYDNEQNVLTSDKIIGFSCTSGSTSRSKMIPLTDKQVKIYTKNTVTRMLSLANKYWIKKTGKGITHGFALPLSPSRSDVSPHGLPQTSVVDIAAKRLGFLYPLILYLPLGQLLPAGSADQDYFDARYGLENEDALYIFSVFSSGVSRFILYLKENFEMLLNDIEKGIINDSIYMQDDIRKSLEKKLRPNPKRAAALRKEFEKGFDNTILSRIWPNMHFINMIGTSSIMKPYAEEVQKYSTGIPVDYSIYGASEGLCAAAYSCDNPGQLMLLDSCFYEFIEQKKDDDEEIENPEILTVDKLEIGKEYEIIITNTSGLYRYRHYDIILVLGKIGTCPVINFVRRKGQLINLWGEKTTLEQMANALSIFQKKTGLSVYHWAIRGNRNNIGAVWYEVFCEGQGKEMFSDYSEDMDNALCEANSKYAEWRKTGWIMHVKVFDQAPGTHEEWRAIKIEKGASSAQVKPVTVLDNDEKQDFFSSRIVSAEAVH